MGVGGTIFNVILGLLVLATIASFAYAGYTWYQSTNIQPGTIVQTTFTGNVAFLTSALIGPKGELAAALAPQDALNMLYCDVPGSAGAYSSWYRPAGSSAQYDPYTQASYTSVWNTSYSCDTDADCNAKPWLECGYVGNCWPGGTYSGNAAWTDDVAGTCCGAATSNDPTDPTNWMVCSFTSADAKTSGVCSITHALPSGGAPFTCNTDTHRCVPTAALPAGATECKTDADCSSVPAGACNVLSGYCQPDYGEHVLINTPWLAEGVVQSLNSDGSANVQWTRVRNMYAWSGPTLPWFPQSAGPWNYQQCVFIASIDSANSVSSSTNNVNATAMALGLGSLGTDVAGLPTLSAGNAFEPATNVWNTVGGDGYGWMGSLTSGQTYSGLPLLAEVGASHSAWNLQALSLSTDSLKRVPAYTIQNTAGGGFNATLLASVTAFRPAYMIDRPPHLQLPSSS